MDVAKCGCVVGLHRRWGLRVAHCDKGVPGGNCFSAINVESAKLRLGGGGHDVLNYLGDCHNSPIIGDIFQIVGHVEMAARAAL